MQDTLLDRISRIHVGTSVIDESGTYSYAHLSAAINKISVDLKRSSVARGAVVAIRSDFSFDSIALLIALIEYRTIVVLIPESILNEEDVLREMGTHTIFRSSADGMQEENLGHRSEHELVNQLRRKGHAGIVFFTSGSTGKPKAVLHDVNLLLEGKREAKKALKTLAFLLFDHIAGIDTLFYTLLAGGSLVVSKDRSTKEICRLIEQHSVEVLPVSPSFLNLLILSCDYMASDLSSVEILTYGSEPMPSETLLKINEIFSEAKVMQKYGTTEFGSPKSVSKSNGELWIKLDSEGFRTKIKDDILWVKSNSLMLGYLNAEQPARDGDWVCTGDVVRRDGDWLIILGRDSDLINVGGEKVYPSEVEGVLLTVDQVQEAAVFSEPSAILGNIVAAKVRIEPGTDTSAIRREIRRHTLKNLQPYKVPMKVYFTDEPLTNSRQKLSRIKKLPK